MAGSLRELFESAGDDREKTTLSDLFSASDPIPLAIAPETKRYLNEALPSIDIEIDCDVMMEGGSLPPALAELVESVQSMSAQLQAVINYAQSENIVLCDLSRGFVDFNGMHSNEYGLIAVNTAADTPLRTATEEFVHTYQDHPRLSPQEYALPDFNIWKLGIEAQAKLSVAVEAVRMRHYGDNSLFDDHLTGIHREVAEYLNQEVDIYGIGALEDPDILREGFYLFMGSDTFTSSYIARFVPDGPGLDQSVGANRVSIEDFANQFGTIVGGDPRNNFLEGKLNDFNDLMELFPPSTRLALNLQYSRLATTVSADPSLNDVPILD